MDQALLVFITAADLGNFSRAAEALHMTQPSVSQHIKNLEDDMDVSLMERTNKKVQLTKAGEVVYAHSRDMLGTDEQMRRRVYDMTHQPGGSLTIGASYTFGEYILPHVLANLLKAYPDITPDVTIHNTHEIADMVAERRLDIGIVEGDIPYHKQSLLPFADDALVIVASVHHPLAARENITLEELADERWIVREEGSGTRSVTEQMFSSFAFTPLHKMAFGSTQVIKESVEAQLGISFLSEWAIRKERQLQTLKVLPVAHFPYVRQFSLMTQDTPYQTKASQVFQEMLSRPLAY